MVEDNVDDRTIRNKVEYNTMMQKSQRCDKTQALPLVITSSSYANHINFNNKQTSYGIGSVIKTNASSDVFSTNNAQPFYHTPGDFTNDNNNNNKGNLSNNRANYDASGYRYVRGGNDDDRGQGRKINTGLRAPMRPQSSLLPIPSPLVSLPFNNNGNNNNNRNHHINFNDKHNSYGNSKKEVICNDKKVSAYHPLHQLTNDEDSSDNENENDD